MTRRNEEKETQENERIEKIEPPCATIPPCKYTASDAMQCSQGVR